MQPGYYSYSFIPKSYRRPEWEKLSLPVLRGVIKEAEGELEPEAQRLLDVARGGLRQITAPVKVLENAQVVRPDWAKM
jgi:hypothetical protein